MNANWRITNFHEKGNGAAKAVYAELQDETGAFVMLARVDSLGRIVTKRMEERRRPRRVAATA